MKRKRVIVSDGKIIHDGNAVRIVQEINGEMFFEIGNEITSDIAEAVAIMLRNNKIKQITWDVEVSYSNSNISPDKCLYWLSGGDREWSSLKNYNRSWSEVYMLYNKEFGDRVIDILNESKTLGDVRDNFIKYLNLPTLYEFALSKKFVK